MESLLAIAVPWAAGWIVKAVSKARQSVGHKVAAPAAAFIVACLVQFFGLEDPELGAVVTQGGQAALIASGLQSWAKNILQRFGWNPPI